MAKKNKKIESVIKRKPIENQNKIAYLFILPWLIGFLTFTLFPFVYSFYATFFNINAEAIGWTKTWAGLNNYKTAIITNPDFKPLIANFVMNEVIFTPTILVVGFILALLLNQNIKGRSFFRVVFFLPVIVLSGSAMQQIISNGGALEFAYNQNFIFRMLHSYVPWITDIMETLFDNFTLMLWYTGIPIVLFINGLQKINPNLYEAAKIDGANSWQILWKITLPNVKSTALIVSIFTICQVSTYNIGGNASLFGIIEASIYANGIGFGLASTFAWLYTIVMLIFVGIAFLLFGREKKIKQKKLTSIQKARLEAIFEKKKLEVEARK